MLILDKPRALDRMLYLSDHKANAVPTEFLRPSSPLHWTGSATGRRLLSGEVVLRPPVLEPALSPIEPELGVLSS